MRPQVPLKALLARSEADRATLDRVWAGVRRREARRYLAPLVAGLATACALALTGGLLWLHAARGVQVPAPVASRARVTGTVQVRPGIEVAAGAGSVVWVSSAPDGRAVIDAEHGEVHLSVDRGTSCLVTSQRLSFEVAAAEIRFEAGADADSVLVEQGEVVAREPGAEARRVRSGESLSSGPGWRALAASGDLRGAWGRLGHDGVANAAAASSSLEEKTLLADIAAVGHDSALAVTLLEAVVAAPGAAGPERAIAAYDLGLRLLENGEPSKAARAFERSLSMELPAALRGDARARAAEASLRAGDTVTARRWLDAAEH